MSKADQQSQNPTSYAIVKLGLLLALFVWMFRPELRKITSGALGSAERVHALVVPVMILLLVWHRRHALTERIGKGSAFGPVLVIVGLLLYAAATWPFSYGYARDIAMVPVLAGVVLAACSRRSLKPCLPMLLLYILAIPIGGRIYARLIIRPETYTIKLTAAAVGKLPGVDTTLKGADVFFESRSTSGVVALGRSNRGARLLSAFAALGTFVVFSKIRSAWRLLVIAVAAVPIVLICNLFRFLCWAMLDVYAAADPAALMPQNLSSVLSLLLAYALFAIISSLRVDLFVEADENAAREDHHG
ncbi:MAG: exosortase/archaeosortase family protein [Phycisphaerales bacterium]|nr:MAG: exosortase/archaeosortase family protein [Phycisphaerales bacterium]